MHGSPVHGSPVHGSPVTQLISGPLACFSRNVTAQDDAVLLDMGEYLRIPDGTDPSSVLIVTAADLSQKHLVRGGESVQAPAPIQGRSADPSHRRREELPSSSDMTGQRTETGEASAAATGQITVAAVPMPQRDSHTFDNVTPASTSVSLLRIYQVISLISN